MAISIGNPRVENLARECRKFISPFNALAKALNKPLLFKGNDFTHTDIESALG